MVALLTYFEEQEILSIEELFIKARDAKDDVSLQCKNLGLSKDEMTIFFEKLDICYSAIVSMRNLMLKANSQLSQVSSSLVGNIFSEHF